MHDRCCFVNWKLYRTFNLTYALSAKSKRGSIFSSAILLTPPNGPQYTSACAENNAENLLRDFCVIFSDESENYPILSLHPLIFFWTVEIILKNEGF